MKNKYLLLLYLIAVFIITACHSEKMDEQSYSSKGELNLSGLSLSLDAKVDSLSLSRANTVDINSYIVTITDAQEQQAGKWLYSEMPEVVSLPVGNYRIDVVSAETAEAGFDNPYYAGSQSFEIKKNEVTQVSGIVCKLSNVRLSFTMDAAFKEKSDDDFKVTMSIESSSISMVKSDENRFAYLPAIADEHVLVVAWEGTVDGEFYNNVERFSGVKKGYHHTVAFKFDEVNSGGNEASGGLSVSVSIDGSITEKDDNIAVNPGPLPGIDDFPNEGEEGGENPEPNDITITGYSFGGKPFTMGEELVVTGATELIVKLGVPAGIKNLKVLITSDSPSFGEIAQALGEFDLADSSSMSDAALETLGAFNFPMDEEVRNKTELDFDISQFTSLLLGFPGLHNFKITVVDNNGNELSDKLIIRIN